MHDIALVDDRSCPLKSLVRADGALFAARGMLLSDSAGGRSSDGHGSAFSTQ
jgi:hypothetical protein